MKKYEDLIVNKIKILQGDIVSLAKEKNIDIVVNSANRTLVGGTGVDGAIHRFVKLPDSHETNNLARLIKIEANKLYDISDEDECIRCNEGDVFVTDGFNLSKKIIHAVGPKWDNLKRNDEVEWHFGHAMCSKRCIETLKFTYKAIFENFTELQGETIILPVISSGNYEFNYDVAMRVQFASIYNFLFNLKKCDEDRYSRIKYIYIVAHKDYQLEYYEKFYNKYKKTLTKESSTIQYLKFIQSHSTYVQEINKFDKNRNYFGITLMFRRLILFFSFFNIPTIFSEQFFKNSIFWISNRKTVDRKTFAKLALSGCSLIFFYKVNVIITDILTVILLLSLLGTVNSILNIVLFMDIKNKVANINRSIILLFVNYIDINLIFAFLFLKFKAFGVTNAKESAIVTFTKAYEIGSKASISEMILGFGHKSIMFLIIIYCLTYFMCNLIPIKNKE